MSVTFFFIHDIKKKIPNSRGASCKPSSFFEVFSNYFTEGFKLPRNYKTDPDQRICFGLFQNGIVIHVNTVGVLELNACLRVRGDHIIIANRELHVKLNLSKRHSWRRRTKNI